MQLIVNLSVYSIFLICIFLYRVASMQIIHSWNLNKQIDFPDSDFTTNFHKHVNDSYHWNIFASLYKYLSSILKRNMWHLQQVKGTFSRKIQENHLFIISSIIATNNSNKIALFRKLMCYVFWTFFAIINIFHTFKYRSLEGPFQDYLHV